MIKVTENFLKSIYFHTREIVADKVGEENACVGMTNNKMVVGKHGKIYLCFDLTEEGYVGIHKVNGCIIEPCLKKEKYNSKKELLELIQFEINK